MRNILSNSRLAASLLFSVLGLCAFPGAADPAAFDQDTHVRANKPNNNYGGVGVLWVNEAFFRQSYVQFDTTNFGGVVIQAVVSVYVSNVTQPGNIDIYPVQQNWNGSSMTFANSPALGGSQIATIAVSAVDNGSYVTADITSLVQTWVDDSLNNMGIALVPSNGVVVKLSSGESGFPPMLDVSDDGTPPPPPPPPPPAPGVVIHSAITDLGTETLTITGLNFDMGASPLVLLGDIGSLTISGTPTPTLITADLPSGIADGDYLLRVSLGDDADQNVAFDLTVGSVGVQGPAGLAGPDGAPGAAGPQGAIGPAGPQGDAGMAGLNGAVGPDGPPGAIGPAGLQGAIGPTGDMGPQGLPGVVGAIGPQGPVGAAGAQGEIGPAGSAGLMGPDGPVGAIGFTGIAGPQGAVGPMGSQGPMGAQGATGTQGPAGRDGVTGPVGPAGPDGPQGAEGPQGPAGVPGSSSSYANLAIVAITGGDYSSPIEAMNNAIAGDTWCPLPSATQRCLVQIMPGVFDLGAAVSSGALTMQKFIDIAGAGQSATLLSGTGSSSIDSLVRVVADAQLRDLTVYVSGGTHAIAIRGIGNQQQSGTTIDLLNITAKAFGGSFRSWGIMMQNQFNGQPKLRNITAHAESPRSSIALYNSCASVDLDGAFLTAQSTASGGSGGVARGIDDSNNPSNCLVNFRGRLANVRVSAEATGPSSVAIAAYIRQSQSYIQNMVATAKGGSFRTSGAEISQVSTAIISGSYFEGSGGTNNYGMHGLGGGDVRIIGSTLAGSTAAARMEQSGAQGPAILRIGNSRLSGGAVSTTGTGTITCAGVYDENFVFSASTCP